MQNNVRNPFGFLKMDGVTRSKIEYYKALIELGWTVKKTKKGVLVYR